MFGFLSKVNFAKWIHLILIPIWIEFSTTKCDAQPNVGRRTALLIACQDYQPQLEQVGQKKLDSPRKDMALLERELKHLNYQVRRIEGDSTAALSKSQIVDQIEKFIGDIQIQDDVLIYLSGHGVQLYSDRNDGLYFVPEQASVEDVSGLEDPGDGFYIDNGLISIAWIADLLDNRQANNRVMILDCCRSKAKQENKIGKKKPRTSPAKRVNIVYAASEGQAAFESADVDLNILDIDGFERKQVRSKFTANLIKYLRGEYSQDSYKTDASGNRILELDDALNQIGNNLSDQAPISAGNTKQFTLGTPPPYTWDIQQYTANLQPREKVSLGALEPLEFLLVNPMGIENKKLQFSDNKKYERTSNPVNCDLQMPFYLSVTEASCQNWIDCLEDPIAITYLNSIQAPSNLRTDLLNRFKKPSQDLNLPAPCTWPEAILLCQLMTKKVDRNTEGFYKICRLEFSKNPPRITGIEYEFRPDAFGFRLPAEAQWHWAVFQDKDPLEIIKAAGGRVRALQNGVEIPTVSVGLNDPSEQLTSGFRYALGNMAEWLADDWIRTDSIRVVKPIHSPSNCGQQKKLGDKLLKGGGVLDNITDQRRQSKPGVLDKDHGLRVLYQPSPQKSKL